MGSLGVLMSVDSFNVGVGEACFGKSWWTKRGEARRGQGKMKQDSERRHTKSDRLGRVAGGADWCCGLRPGMLAEGLRPSAAGLRGLACDLRSQDALKMISAAEKSRP